MNAFLRAGALATALLALPALGAAQPISQLPPGYVCSMVATTHAGNIDIACQRRSFELTEALMDDVYRHVRRWPQVSIVPVGFGSASARTAQTLYDYLARRGAKVTLELGVGSIPGDDAPISYQTGSSDGAMPTIYVNAGDEVSPRVRR